MTRRVEYGDADRLMEWSRAVNGVPFLPDARVIGMVRDTGEVLATIVFEAFTDYECDVHIATAGTGQDANREFYIRCFAFVFMQLRLRRINGLIPARNLKSQRLALHFGFVYEGRKREALPGDDILLFGMLRRECRFIPAKHRT